MELLRGRCRRLPECKFIYSPFSLSQIVVRRTDTHHTEVLCKEHFQHLKVMSVECSINTYDLFFFFGSDAVKRRRIYTSQLDRKNSNRRKVLTSWSGPPALSHKQAISAAFCPQVHSHASATKLDLNTHTHKKKKIKKSNAGKARRTGQGQTTAGV